MRFAYADPPYPGLARRYYAGEDNYAGEVDHVALIARLEAGGFDGWALSTSARALRWLLPLCPERVRVCPWVKPIAPSPQTFGPHNTWEALLVVGGRRRRPGVRDWLRAHPARGGGELPGRKPLAFAAWLFDLLCMQPGDTLEDLFPGSGIIGRAWAELSRGVPYPSLLEQDNGSGDALLEDASSSADDDVSPGAGDDVSAEVLGDASPTPAWTTATATGGVPETPCSGSPSNPPI